MEKTFSSILSVKESSNLAKIMNGELKPKIGKKQFKKILATGKNLLKKNNIG